jgi:hypothetical protein
MQLLKTGGARRWRRVAGFTVFLTLIGFFVLGPKPWQVFAQADPGYAKVGTVNGTTTTFTDTTVQDGLFYQYEVTAVNAVLESTAASDGVQSIPVTGTHTVKVTWVASTTDANHSAPTSYNIYRGQVFAPNPPGAVSIIVN